LPGGHQIQLHAQNGQNGKQLSGRAPTSRS
jgi:hypothetical protein